ncbi:proepiregulin [Hyla sarda]|uniref:proepiregulin n=1 Tax=Hyla sarda TaxID=327740 RepID=UPI0024C25218|nr:proepiregulin [Hyla sarda]
MSYWRRISSALVFLYLHILQIVWCQTTVAPCKSGENCTTALMHTTVSPEVAVVRIVECAADIGKYCVNGQCLYLLDEDEHYCRCEHGYMGLRCADSDIVKKQPMTEEYLALIIFLTALLLLAVALIVFFAYKWYALKKSSQPNQKYKEVSTQNI